MFDRIIAYSFYLLFFLTPLFWTSLNHELFEFNKMFLTYGITVVIVGTWLLKAINDKQLTINRTPLDIPLLLFLGANILSTIFSIDTHTSIWGYYSRLNGGLLSIISYLLLYWAFVSNMDKEKVFTSLKFALASGVIVSLWGILEHFGVSPSCVILLGEFNASCWVQDVQARVFATLGQPNWMAGYLAMLIFPALYFFLTAKNKLPYYLLLTTYYLSFTFTYSRGPTLGLLAGAVIFVIFAKITKPLLLVAVSFLVISILFGSSLTSFRLVSQFAPPPRPSIALPTTTQLETGGTESGQIRFIVWQGALDIFKAYPIFGSGVETFGLSYYQFRPAAHNLVSEWDFLYNKAHNEYLNILANTGAVGFATYLAVILTFAVWAILRIINSHDVLHSALLASYISYLVQNIFGFSVVAIALFFFLFPALAYVASGSAKPLKIPLSLHLLPTIFKTIYHRPFYTWAIKVIVILSTIYLLFSVFKLWYADTLFAKGISYSEAGNPGQAYNYLTGALSLNTSEPYYQSELGYAAAAAALALQDSDATLSAELKKQAIFETEKVLKENPKNVSYFRTAVRTYFELSGLDQTYTQKTIESLNQAIKLAPTDPKLLFNKALILQSMDRDNEAVLELKKALELKPNYLEAQEQLDEISK